MEIQHLFFRNREAALNEILKLNEKTEEELKKDIEILRTWLNTQKHLPEIPNDNMIMNFLIMNKFSIEMTKQKLDMFYTIRGLLPEIFVNKHPNLPCIKDIKDSVRIIVLPKLTEKHMRVTVFQVKDANPEKFDLDNYLGYSFNLALIRINEDIVNSDIYIYDFKHLRPGHVTKMNPLGIKKSGIIMEKVYSNRVSQIHFINCPSYADTVIKICKAVMNPKIAGRINVHKGYDTLFDFIPAKTLPKDYGGEELSLEELEALWSKKQEEYYDRFEALETLKVNESLRSRPLENDEILGFHGNFKKLTVD